MPKEPWQQLVVGALVVVACLYFGSAAYNAVFSSPYEPTDQQVSDWCSSGVEGAMEHLDAVHGDNAVEAAEAVAASMNLGECVAAIRRVQITLKPVTFSTGPIT